MSLQFFCSSILLQRLNEISVIQLPWTKTYLGFMWPCQQIFDTMDMLHRFKNLHEIRIVDVGDQSWSTSWYYSDANVALVQAMRKTRAKIVVGNNMIRDKPVVG